MDKSVSFVLKAYTADADERLKAMQDRLDKLTKFAKTITLGVDDKKARLEVDSFLMKLSGLNQRRIGPEITLKGYFKTLAEIDRLELKMDDLGSKTITAGKLSGVDRFLSLFSFLPGITGGGGGGGVASAAAGAGSSAAATGPAWATAGIIAGVTAGSFALPGLAGLFATLGVGAAGFYSALKTDTKATKEFSGALADIERTAGRAFLPVVNQVAGFFKSISPAVGKLVASAAPGLLAFFKALAPAIRQAIPELTQFIKAFAPYMGELGHTAGIAILAITRALLNLEPAFKASVHFIHGFVGVAAGLFDFLARFIGDMVRIIGDLFSGKWRDAWRHAEDILRYAFDGFRTLALKFLIWSATTWIPGLVRAIGHGLSHLPAILTEIGRQAMEGFLAGLRSMPIIGTLESIFGGGVATIKHILGIKSPSTVAMGIGRNFTEGFYIGLNQAGASPGVHIAGRRGGGGGGQPLQIVLRFEGSMAALVEALKPEIFHRGGGGVNSVQIALGQRH